MLNKNKDQLQNLHKSIQLEWLETNGLGGWAGSTVPGVNTRRYHGLLVAAVVPPAERMVLLSKLDETIVIDNQRIELGTNQYRGDIIHPNGYEELSHFSREMFPSWEYFTEDIRLKKTIAMRNDENTTLIIYEVLDAQEIFTLELKPFIAARGYHALIKSNETINRESGFENEVFSFKPYQSSPNLYLKIPGSSYKAEPDWYYHFQYFIEKYRGLDFEEDLFTPGRFTIQLKKGGRLEIIVSTDNPEGRDAHTLFNQEKLRREKLIENAKGGQLFQQLVLAADQFIVKRGEELKTIIAGYHWFTDWGRDTMISLPGLCLSTGRFEDARKILAAFAASVSQGMLPNRFQDNGEEPEYNNVDGTLWYFIAIQKYLDATGDRSFVLNELLPVLKDIIDSHFKGTRYDIRVDDDGLLSAGEIGQQLTWMDARIGDWVVTPRMGKPVEIQALWYNTLRIFANLLEMNDQHEDAVRVNQSAMITKSKFEEEYWYEQGGYLYDVIDEHGQKDTSLRPNQLFALSLPYKLVEGERAKSILEAITNSLYTPVGLRSLAADDDRYIPVYGGDTWHRDSAYHQGTVWSWLLGPYVDAIMTVYNDKNIATKIINAFSYHLNEGCIGSISEIFDAQFPHAPRGCVAQAWSVAELLRVVKAYDLHN